MGQKVNPCGFRIGPTLYKNWYSVLYAKKDYGNLLIQDLKIRKLISKDYSFAYVSSVSISRPSTKAVIVDIYVKKPAAIIGRKGDEIEKLKKKIFNITEAEVYINVHEVEKPETDAALIAQNIVYQLEKRQPFKKAMKRSIQSCMKNKAKGIKVMCSGRLGGAEIARTEQYKDGKVPLQVLKADINYATAEAHTTYGVIGVKVWVYKGDYTNISKDRR